MQDVCQSSRQSASGFAQANVLYRHVGQQLLQHLEPINIKPDTILDISCGALGSPLTACFPEATVTHVDLGFETLKHNIKSVALNRINAKACKLSFAESQFDLVIANLMPHWLDNLSAWLMEMQRVLRINGLLMFSYYGPDTLNEVVTSQLGCYDLHTMGDALVRAAFNDPVLDVGRFIVDYDDYADLLEDLQANGEHNLFVLSAPPKGNLEVTYEIIYAHAWKLEQPMTSKIDQDGMVRISPEQIRYR